MESGWQLGVVGDPIQRPGGSTAVYQPGDHQSVYHLNQPIAWQNNQ